MSSSPPRAPRGGRILQKRARLTLVLATLTLLVGSAAHAQTSPAPETDVTSPTVPEQSPTPTPPGTEAPPPGGLPHDAALYFTAHLRRRARHRRLMSRPPRFRSNLQHLHHRARRHRHLAAWRTTRRSTSRPLCADEPGTGD